MAIALVCSSAPARAAGEAPGSFTLNGSLYTASGSAPLLDAHARVRVQIFSNPGCVLYEEEQELDTSNSDGAFTMLVGAPLGSSRRVGSDSNNTLTQVFQNRAAVIGNNNGCSESPVAGASRYVRVIVTPSGEAPQTLSPDLVMNSVSSALVADTLQGLPSASFAQLGFESLTQAKLQQIFSNANFTTLLGMLTGGGASTGGSTSGAYTINSGSGGSSGGINLQVNGTTRASLSSTGNFDVGGGKFFVSAADGRIGLGTTTPAASLDLSAKTDALLLPRGSDGDRPLPAAAGMLRFSTTSNKIEFHDGSGWVNVGGDISGIAAGGDLSGTYPNPTVSQIRGQSVSAAATTDGQVLRFNGTAYVPRYVALSDLKNTAGGNAFSATCSASQTLTWNSINDTFTCTAIGGLDAGAITGGTIANARLPASATVWGAVTDGIAYSGGKVAIGTTTITEPFTMRQDLGVASGENHLASFRRLGGAGAGVSIGYRAAGSAETAGFVRSTASLPLVLGTAGFQNMITLSNGGSTSITGNVGIGSASPSVPLDVAGDVNSTGWYRGNGNSILRYLSGTTTLRGGSIMLDAPNAGNVISFSTNGTTKVTIDNGGNVGIGSATPNSSLDLSVRTDAVSLPKGDDAARPTTAAVAGMIRWNTTSSALEVYNGTAWVTPGAGGGSGYLSSSGGTLSGGLTISTGGLNNSSGGITNAGSITGVGTNITGSDYLVVAAGGSNKSLTLRSSGNGVVNLGTGNGTAMRINDAAGTSVNFVTLKGAAAGSSPVLGTGTDGTDPDVDLTISPRGAGRTVFANGNVGIGSTAPGTPLDVTGIARASRFTANGSLNQFGTPTHSFNNDSDTGMYLIANDTLGFSTGATERVRIAATGAVGIGTATPTTGAILDVNGTGANSAMMLPRDNTAARPTGAAGMIRYNNQTNQIEAFNGTSWYILASTTAPTFTSSIGLSVPSSTAYVSTDAANPYPTVASLGLNINNGIGADNAGSFIRLGARNTANATQGAVIGVVSNSTGNTPSVIIGQQTGASSYGEQMRLDPSGNLGIGTTAPTAKLHVAGAIKIVDGSQAPGRVLTSDTNGLATWATPAGGSSQWTTTGSSDIYFAGGKVGIGTTAPTAGTILDLNGTGTAASSMLLPRDVTGGRPTSPVAGMFRYNTGTKLLEWYDGFNWLSPPSNTAGIFSTSATANFSNGSAYNASGTGAAAPASSASYGLIAINNANTNNTGASVRLKGFNSSGNGQSATLSSISVAGAASYSPIITLTQQTDASAYAERLRIDTNGNLGIGTTGPLGTLHVFRNSPSYAINLNDSWLRAALLAVPSSGGDEAFSVSRSPSAINLQSVGTDGVTAYNLALSPFGGRVAIGLTAPNYLLDVAGDINSSTALRVGGTQICTSAGCTSSSDRTLKENIQPLKGSLEKILKVHGVSYDWKNKAKYGAGPQVGVIAQDLEKIYPEVVSTDPKSGLRSVAYDHLVAPIIEALRELTGASKQQAEEIKALRARNQDLEQRLERLERALASTPAQPGSVDKKSSR